MNLQVCKNCQSAAFQCIRSNGTYKVICQGCSLEISTITPGGLVPVNYNSFDYRPDRKPCPICKTTQTVRVLFDMYSDQAYVNCSECGLSSQLCKDARAAVELWNNLMGELK